MHSNMSPLMHRHSLVPPGFRFHPTDQELVGYYLQKKVASKRIDLDVIREIDLYKMEPWDLQERCMTGSPEQTDWYFFSHKDKKYPTGTRTNRATAAGFWKATGRDKAIRTTFKVIGMRKTLVFYKGRAPNGQKTDWIMHEYRLEDDETNSGSLEDGWVVCRVFRKSNTQRTQDDISSCRDTQQALMFDLPSTRNSYASSSDKTKMVHSFAYKQMAPQTADGCGTSHDVFLQLPDLESPKVHSSLVHFGTKDVPSSNSSNMRNNNCPSPFSLTTTEFDVPEVKSVVTQEMHDWRMDNTQRNSRFQNVDPTNNDQFGDLGLILRFNKERPNYSSNSDIQFWNAPR